MVKFWVDIIRNQKDPFRTYVSDPALLERINTLEKKLKILDFGSGEGYMSRYLECEDHETISFDYSAEMLNAGKELVSNGFYIQGTAEQTPFKDNYFDAIISNFMLMELEHPELAIKEASRILKPGGRFIFQILNPAVYGSNTGNNTDKKLPDYNKKTKFTEHFEIGGVKSPLPASRWHHPQKTYIKAIIDNGLEFVKLYEPQIVKTTPPNNQIRTLMKEPWILLVDTKKII